jgi:hypothetical protein
VKNFLVSSLKIGAVVKKRLKYFYRFIVLFFLSKKTTISLETWMKNKNGKIEK